MILTSLAVLPGALLILYIYRLDKIENEPRSIMTKMFLLGVLSVVPAVILELIMTPFVSSGSFISMLIENFICIALVEEGCKYVMLKASWKNKEFNYQFDGVVYAVTVSMGFAILENILYVQQGGLSTALLRAITSIPGHGIFAIYMGHYYGKAKMASVMKQNEMKKQLTRKALLIPILLHGTYDFLATVPLTLFSMAFIVFVIAIEVIAFIRVREYSKRDMPFPNIQ